MRKILIVAAMLATLSTMLLHTGPALALNSKSWVADNGVDTNDCHDAANACRTFKRALAQTNPGGEIGVINAGDYAPFEIRQSVTITNDGAGEAGLLRIDASTCLFGQQIIIDASPGDIVSLRGLVFEGCGSQLNGIGFFGGAALHVQNCIFRNFEGGAAAALLFEPTGNSKLFVSDSTFFNNGSGPGSGGIVVEPTGTGSADVVLEHVQLEDNVVGLYFDATGRGSVTGGNGIHVVLRDSVVSGNAADGISVLTQSGGPPAFLFMERSSTVSNAGNGILANGPRATVLLSDSTITRNGTGVSAINGGQLISYGNNRNNNNIGAEGVATGSLAPTF